MDEIKGDCLECFMALKDTKAREVGEVFGVEPLLACVAHVVVIAVVVMSAW